MLKTQLIPLPKVPKLNMTVVLTGAKESPSRTKLIMSNCILGLICHLYKMHRSLDSRTVLVESPVTPELIKLFFKSYIDGSISQTENHLRLPSGYLALIGVEVKN